MKCNTTKILLFIYYLPFVRAGAEVKASACNVGDLGSIPGSGRSLEKEIATHSSILAWRIPWTEELSGLQSTGRKESDTTERLHFTQAISNLHDTPTRQVLT